MKKKLGYIITYLMITNRYLHKLRNLNSNFIFLYKVITM